MPKSENEELNQSKDFDFVIPNQDEEDEPPTDTRTTVGRAAAESFNEPAHEAERPANLPYTAQPADIDLPEGFSERKSKSSGGLNRAFLGIALCLVAVVLFGGIILIRKMTKSEQTVDVKNSPSSNSAVKTPAESERPDDVQKAIDMAKLQPNPTVTPTPGTPTNQSTVQTGTILDQPNGNYPVVASPILDPRYNSASVNQPNTASGGNSGGFNSGGNSGGGLTTAPNNPKTVLPTPTPEVKTRENTAYRSDNSRGGRNEQSSLYFYSKSESVPNNFITTNYKPPFGTTLPVRVVGALHSLQSGGLVRMELTRTVEGTNWRLNRGTVFVGRVAGSGDKRLFVSMIGYLDTRSNALVEISGDSLGRDGAIGFEGEKKRLNSRWKKIFGDALNKATQLGTAYLLGRRGGSSSILQSGGGFSTESLLSGNQSENSFYVVVPAGAVGYILINDLPKKATLPASPLEDSFGNSLNPSQPIVPPPGQISEEELFRILTNGSDDEIKAAYPRMSPEWQDIARNALAARAGK